MTNPSFNSDDPRLTAFVLGELDDADRAAVEQLLESSPEARAFVDDLQDTIGALRDELSAESAPALTNDQRAALQQAAAIAETAAGQTQQGSASTTHSRRGLYLGTTATIAALGIVVAILPQFAAQRTTNSPAIALRISDEEASSTSAGSAVAMSETSDRHDATLSAIRDIAQLENPRESPAASDGADPATVTAMKRKLAPADEAPADASKTLLQVVPQVAAGSKDFRAIQEHPFSDTKSDRSGAARSDAAVTLGSSSRLTTAPSPAGAAGIGGAVSREERLSGNVAKASPGRPAQIAETRSNPAPDSHPTSAPAVSVASGLARNPSAKPIAEGAPVAMPVQMEAARGLQSTTPQLAGQQRGSRIDNLAVTTTGESLRESERNQAIRSRRIVPPADPYFLEQGETRGGFALLQKNAGNETYDPIVENEFVVPDAKDADKRLSTISVDVDTAAYANVRRFLMQDRLPPPNAVRIEELVNYFKYDYPQPKGDDPFSVTTEVMLCPWQPGHRLARIGLHAKTIDKSQRPPANLVFLLDVSGSMRPANKLPLVQQAMRLLVEEMTEDDQIAIVTYASNAGLRLVSTPGSKKPEILQAIDSLTAGGSTNGEGGIKLAYDTAIRHYVEEGANRVILCTDGDFNVGISNDNELVELIQEKAASGVFLSVFGFGMGNLKDGKLEKLADKGNGQYGYIDSLQEARRAFNDDLAGTLYTVAKDVKLQAEFNPATVGAYRLIGYENRKLAAADFTDDTKDAGEIGAGHTVTALYEIIPRQVMVERLKSNELRYGGTFELPVDGPKVDGFSDELFYVRLRYKQPDEETSQPVEADYPVSDVAITGKPVAAPSTDFQFAAAVASFGMNLRNSQYRGNWDLRHVYDVAVQTRGDDPDGRRAEFIDLVQRTMRIVGQQVGIDLQKLPISERPAELTPSEARIKAAVDGKYRRLLKKIEVRDDLQQYGAFNDFGFWDKSTEYKGHSDLLPGYWVYVYPHWYIWAEAVEARVSSPETKPGEASGTSDSAGKPAAESPGKQ